MNNLNMITSEFIDYEPGRRARMIMSELDNIKDFWAHKFPAVTVSLWSNEKGTKYFGNMITPSTNHDISAYTISELIEHGEDFLRRLKS